MKSITRRQSDVFNFIKLYLEEHGYPPTRRNITDEFGFKSPNAAEEHLRALDKKGYIELRRNTSRGIIIKDTRSGHLPIVGRVAAGSPILAEEHIEKNSTVSGSIFDPAADYLLRVQGESMTGIGIYDGDLLAVHKTQLARDNQIVVARLDDEVTVKRFKHDHENREIHLIPENSEYRTIRVHERSPDLQIEGISVGLIRMRI
ncbi:MAG: transcriptional repressor LexA [Gammaproteobacteria bacterium]|nr:transcriptional repressor LexA [Gammaproteobacteria bacterium]